MKLWDETFGFFVLLLCVLLFLSKKLERAQVLRKTMPIIKSSRIVLVFLKKFHVFRCFQKSKGIKGKKDGRKWNSIWMHCYSTGPTICKRTPWHNSPFVLCIWTFYSWRLLFLRNFKEMGLFTALAAIQALIPPAKNLPLFCKKTLTF